MTSVKPASKVSMLLSFAMRMMMTSDDDECQACEQGVDIVEFCDDDDE